MSHSNLPKVELVAFPSEEGEEVNSPKNLIAPGQGKKVLEVNDIQIDQVNEIDYSNQKLNQAVTPVKEGAKQNPNSIKGIVPPYDETIEFHSETRIQFSGKNQAELHTREPFDKAHSSNRKDQNQNIRTNSLNHHHQSHHHVVNTQQSTMSKSKFKHAHEGFDGLKIPADWKKAELHAQSRETKPELDDEPEGGGMQPVCECCGYELSRKKVGLMVDVMDLGFLGSGFPLFYNYIKYCCLMLLSLFLIQGIPNIIYNLKGDFCHYTDVQVYESHEEYLETHEKEYIIPCPSSLLNRMSLANLIDEMKHETNYEFHFSIAAIIVQVFLSILFRRSQRLIESKVDEDNSTPSDFTIMVENICTDSPNMEQKLKEVFSKYGEVMKINLVFDINELEEVEEKIHSVIKKKQAALAQNQYNYKAPEVLKFDEEIKEIEEEEHKISHEIIKHKFVGTAFISFQTEQQKQQAIDNNPQNGYRRFKSYFSNGKSEMYNESIYITDRHLYVSEAPEPNDVDWEFAHVTTESKIKSRISSFMKWALLSLVSFGVICGISYLQSIETEKVLEEKFKLEVEYGEASSSHRRFMSSSSSESTAETSTSTESRSEREAHIAAEQSLITFLSFVISAIIVIWNKFALPIIIHKICDHEKWSTKTSMNISFAQKLTFGLFFNTALITLIVEILVLKNVYAFAGGMIYNEFLVFIFNAVIPSLAWIIDPWKIIQDYRRKKAKSDKNCVLTQEEANLLQEHPNYSMGKRYADIMKTMWFTFFYSPVMPIGTVISLAGLIAYYFTDKYNLLFRRTVKESIGPKLSFAMVEFVEYSMVLHTFGEVLFKYITSYYVDVGNAVLFLCVVVIVTVIPMQKFNELLFPIVSKDDDQKYQDVFLTFDTDYDRENPITKKKAIQDFKEQRQQLENPKINEHQNEQVLLEKN